MPALPTDFLKEAIAEAARYKNIVDAGKQVKENDLTVAISTKIAYTQLCKVAKRPFHWGERVEYYDEYTGPLLLRCFPIDLTLPVKVIVDGEELAREDWRISKGRLIIEDNTESDPQTALFKDIELHATSGLKLCEENSTLFTSLTVQAIGNLHRKDLYGMAEAVGETGSRRTPADSGEVLASVMTMMQDLVYMGLGYTLDGE